MYKFIQMMVALATTSLLYAGCHQAHAEARMGTNTTDVVIKADDKVVDAKAAIKLADDHEMKRCTPIKDAADSSGKEIKAYKCKVVVLEYNPKTGLPHWKAK